MNNQCHVPASRASVRCLLLVATSVLFLGCETAPPVGESKATVGTTGPLEVEWGGVPAP